MNPEKQRIAIAEACNIQTKYWNAIYNNHGRVSRVTFKTKQGADNYTFNELGVEEFINLDALPDYLNDLNAMHEAEKGLPLEKIGRYVCYLTSITNAVDSTHGYSRAILSTAPQRAEAFLKTLNLWEG